MAGLAESGGGAVELAPAVRCTDYVGIPPVAPAAEEGACGDGMLWSADGEVAGNAGRAVREHVVGWVIEDLGDGGSRVVCFFWVCRVPAAQSSCLFICEHVEVRLFVLAVLAVLVVGLVVRAVGVEWCRRAGMGWEVDRW